MLPDSGSLAKAAILEQLVNVTREIDILISRFYRILSESSSLPPADVIDKFFRQDLALAKTNVDRSINRIYEYMASGRLNLLDSKELIFSILEKYETLMRRIEAATYRMLILRRAGYEVEEVDKLLVTLVRLLNEESQELVGLVRRITGAPKGLEALRLVEGPVSSISQTERDADEAYREIIDKLVNTAPDFRSYALYRDAADSLEDAIDTVTDLSRLYRLLVISSE